MFQGKAYALIFTGLFALGTMLSACGGNGSRARQDPPDPKPTKSNPMHLSLALQPQHTSILRQALYNLFEYDASGENARLF